MGWMDDLFYDQEHKGKMELNLFIILQNQLIYFSQPSQLSQFSQISIYMRNIDDHQKNSHRVVPSIRTPSCLDEIIWNGSGNIRSINSSLICSGNTISPPNNPYLN